MMHWNPPSMEFKEFEEARKGRCAIPISELFWKSGAVIDVAEN